MVQTVLSPLVVVVGDEPLRLGRELICGVHVVEDRLFQPKGFTWSLAPFLPSGPSILLVRINIIIGEPGGDSGLGQAVPPGYGGDVFLRHCFFDDLPFLAQGKFLVLHSSLLLLPGEIQWNKKCYLKWGQIRTLLSVQGVSFQDLVFS